MSQEFEGELVVLFVESQNTPQPEAERFVYERGWMAGNGLWTHERPCSSGSGTLPSCVLLGIDGKVLMKGNPGSIKSDLEDAIADQIDLAKELPEGAPSSAKKAWKAFAERDYMDALDGLAKIEAKGREDAAGAAQLRAQVEAKIDLELARIDRLLELGYPLDALVLATELDGLLAEHPTFGPRAAAALAMFEAEDLQPELEAAQAFDKIYAKVREDGVDDSRKKLEKFAEKYAGSKAAERASHLASIAKD
ncbi:hypothetical protein [Engelhardtia mirabilis]|uniref:hypothetical protein n=1 Tax=Engelhardtia mirabilis TaxID=2528011 RepID=UPI00119CAE2B